MHKSAQRYISWFLFWNVFLGAVLSPGLRVVAQDEIEIPLRPPTYRSGKPPEWYKELRKMPEGLLATVRSATEVVGFNLRRMSYGEQQKLGHSGPLVVQHLYKKVGAAVALDEPQLDAIRAAVLNPASHTAHSGSRGSFEPQFTLVFEARSGPVNVVIDTVEVHWTFEWIDGEGDAEEEGSYFFNAQNAVLGLMRDIAREGR